VFGVHPRPDGVCARRQPPPLRAKYRGSLEIVRASDGTLSLIGTLPFRSYLAGLAEVPRSWPAAALRAQVIAARSYALDALRRPTRAARRLGYDICASDRCQVYRGAAVELGGRCFSRHLPQ
jgi:peptidoglycan hydrolase-like amidase